MTDGAAASGARDAEAEPDARQGGGRPTAAARLMGRRGTVRRKATKTAVVLCFTAAVGWAPLKRLAETASAEAVVNARLVTLRSPIDGEVEGSAPEAGASVEPGGPLLRVVDRRADRGRVDDLRRAADALDGERAALLARLGVLARAQDEGEAQARAFAEGRIRQLEARVGETRNEIAAAAATRAEAEAALDRSQALARSGIQTQAVLERARRDASVAAQAEAALGQRLLAVEVELAALRRGEFVGDSYNDRPRSAQRAEELAVRRAEAEADLRERDARAGRLRRELAAEERRHADLAGANVATPVQGSVWEVLTAPGEAVRRGQDLLRVLDCGGAVVTASVSEAVYNRLAVGDAARFRLVGEARERPGRIVRLTGYAAAPANLAIQPAALSREPYRVTVAVPDLAEGPSCPVGRTGRLVFDAGAPGAGAAAARSRP